VDTMWGTDLTTTIIGEGVLPHEGMLPS
jgi:hypothetical protein